MIKWIVLLLVIFGIAMGLSMYANAMPEFFALVTRLVEYLKTNLKPVASALWTFIWGFVLELLNAMQEWLTKIAVKFVGG